jgi:hypothetical protein
MICLRCTRIITIVHHLLLHNYNTWIENPLKPRRMLAIGCCAFGRMPTRSRSKGRSTHQRSESARWECAGPHPKPKNLMDSLRRWHEEDLMALAVRCCLLRPLAFADVTISGAINRARIT